MNKSDMMSRLAGNLDDSIGLHRRPGAAGGVSPRAIPADQVGRERAKTAWTIEVDRIIPDPDQPRKEFDADALDRLAESLRTRGQLQPIQVRWSAADERFIVIMGERRWRAAQMAGLKSMLCVVREGEIDDDERLSIQLIENCLREDLTPIDQSKAFRRLMEQFGWTQERLASELAINRNTVGRVLSLLTLPEAVQQGIGQGGLPAATAYEIAKLDDPAEQIRLATAVEEQGLTRDDVAKQVRRTPVKRKATKLRATEVYRSNGYRIEVTRKAGIDDAAMCEALTEMIERFRRSATSDAA